MRDWLAPVRSALGDASEPIEFFFRDDDAGRDDAGLFALLDVFAERALPLDLAVIPRALSPALAGALTASSVEWEGRLGLHQHGLAHVSHEPDGAKCEFGPARSAAAQRRDLSEGRELLEALLPGMAQPCFTPPWNRCTRTTAELLAEIGFRTLSRHDSEPLLGVPGLAELPVSVDWSYARRAGVRLTLVELGELSAERIRQGGPVGLNLHHDVMDPEERAQLGQLCDLLAADARARCRPMLSLSP